MTPYTLTLHCRKAALFNKTVDGISLASVLKRPATTLERDTLYWHYPHYYQTTSPVSAIRQGKWKLLEFFEDKHLELYNLEEDLGETQNLALNRPQLANDLRQKLQNWRTEVEAQMSAVNQKFAN